jgi:hypothetical protein
VLCHILALLRWHDAQDALRLQTTDDATGPEEDDDQDYVMYTGLDRDLSGLSTQLLFVSSDGVFFSFFRFDILV